VVSCPGSSRLEEVSSSSQSGLVVELLGGRVNTSIVPDFFIGVSGFHL